MGQLILGTPFRIFYSLKDEGNPFLNSDYVDISNFHLLMFDSPILPIICEYFMWPVMDNIT